MPVPAVPDRLEVFPAAALQLRRERHDAGPPAIRKARRAALEIEEDEVVDLGRRGPRAMRTG